MIRLNASFFLGSLSAMRFVTAVQQIEKGGDKLVEQVSRELWRRIWSEDKDITQPQSFSEVVSSFENTNGSELV